MGSKLFYVMLIIFTRCVYAACQSKIVHVVEGETVQLTFQYPCESTSVTLQYANGRPLYDSTNSNSTLLAANQKLNKSESQSDNCSIILTIAPASIDDAGTYTLTVYKNGQSMLPDYLQIELHVGYPPGKASCELSNDFQDGEWVSWNCTAPVGSIAGHIICYQNDVRLPSLTKPVEDGETLSQVILVRLADPVFCCACIAGKYTNSNECKDHVWDPNQTTAPTNFIDTSPDFLSTQAPTTSKQWLDQTPSDPNAEMTVMPTTKKKDSKGDSYWKYFIVIVILVPFAIYLLCCFCLAPCKYEPHYTK